MNMNKKRTSLTLYFCLIILPAFSISVSAQYRSVSWGSVASAGTVDEADKDKVSFDLSQAFLKGSLPDQIGAITSKSEAAQARPEGFINLFADNTVAVIRYNVLPTDGHGFDFYGHTLGVRALVTMNGSKVLVNFYEVDNVTGVKTLRIVNNTTTANPNYRTTYNTIYTADWLFDFKNKTYFVEATLIRTDLRAKVGIEFIHYDNTAGLHSTPTVGQ